jgi:hypothetical protein
MNYPLTFDSRGCRLLRCSLLLLLLLVLLLLLR